MTLVTAKYRTRTVILAFTSREILIPWESKRLLVAEGSLLLSWQMAPVCRGRIPKSCLQLSWDPTDVPKSCCDSQIILKIKLILIHFFLNMISARQIFFCGETLVTEKSHERKPAPHPSAPAVKGRCTEAESPYLGVRTCRYHHYT